MNSSIIYIMGVSGCGKSTIGQALSKKLEIPFYDGDDFHSTENIAKMTSGHPLSDDDRKGWLEAIHDFSTQQEQSVIIACSALKESYREVLSKDIKAKWVYLHADFQTIASRMKGRSDHFMPDSLIQSQFDILEPPKNAIEVDATQSIASIINDIVTKLSL